MGIVENKTTMENEGIHAILFGHLNPAMLEAKSLPYNFMNK